jgi:arsenite/tail-anchored protein-transporting ATPase
VSSIKHSKLAPLVIVLGKGGVGKTTVARGLCELSAQAGTASLRVELGRGSSIAGPDAGAVLLDEEAALEDAVTTVFGSRTVARGILGHAALSRVARVVPGLRELALLTAARALLGRYARVVIDLPSTGHGLAWLTSSSALERLVTQGPAWALARDMSSALRDPEQTTFLTVTLPEPIVQSETRELTARLAGELGRAPLLAVTNQRRSLAPTFAADARALAARSPAHAGQVAALVRWAGRAREADEADAADADVATLELPCWLAGPSPGAVAARLATRVRA